MALILGGAALVCSGVVFLLPRGRKHTVEEDIEEVEQGLARARQIRDDFS